MHDLQTEHEGAVSVERAPLRPGVIIIQPFSEVRPTSGIRIPIHCEFFPLPGLHSSITADEPSRNGSLTGVALILAIPVLDCGSIPSWCAKYLHCIAAVSPGVDWRRLLWHPWRRRWARRLDLSFLLSRYASSGDGTPFAIVWDLDALRPTGPREPSLSLVFGHILFVGRLVLNRLCPPPQSTPCNR